VTPEQFESEGHWKVSLYPSTFCNAFHLSGSLMFTQERSRTSSVVAV